MKIIFSQLKETAGSLTKLISSTNPEKSVKAPVDTSTSKKSAYRKFIAENPPVAAPAFDERKYLADRCRLIVGQAFGIGGGFGNGHIHLAMRGIEDYLLSVRSPLAIQMLTDLQNFGYNGFANWCEKYNV
jgi:hypothetical protein